MAKKKKAVKLSLLAESTIWLTKVNGNPPAPGSSYTPPVEFEGVQNVINPVVVCTLIGPVPTDTSNATLNQSQWTKRFDSLPAGSYVFEARLDGSPGTTGPFLFTI